MEQYSKDSKFSKIYPNYEAFIRANSTPVQSVIIKINPDKRDEVQQQIDQEYGNKVIFSKSKYRQDNFKQQKLGPLIFLSVMVVVESILAIITILFINKLAVRARGNDVKVFKIISIPNNKIINFYRKYCFMNIFIAITMFIGIVLVIYIH